MAQGVGPEFKAQYLKKKKKEKKKNLFAPFYASRTSVKIDVLLIIIDTNRGYCPNSGFIKFFSKSQKI
jgi:hypothetical protein